MAPRRNPSSSNPRRLGAGPLALAMAAPLALMVLLSSRLAAAPERRHAAPAKAAAPPVEKVEFNRDIRPILSAKCFACHGQDPKALQAGLRLDLRAVATGKLASGERAIVPGNPAASEMVQRITATVDALRMPPVDSHKVLSAAEKQTLIRWIAEGAQYKQHWAFVKPVRPPLPAVQDRAWPHNSIDYFVLARLEKDGLKPSPEADRATLLRRVSLDLTGIPPTPAQVDAFLADRSPNAYEKVVDRLLASPRYGERMAMTWMDGARYADSNGYQADYERYQWRWRDWVIDAFNHNMPFDEFTVDQLAGDLLPHATLSQQIATGFNRNHRINTEGGVIPEEWRTETVIDRVETTSQVWLGLTMGCARCHDHKYDPIPQKDFYRFYAFFNNVPETGSGVEMPVNHPPILKTPTPRQAARLEAMSADVARMDAQITAKEKDASAVAAPERLAAVRRSLTDADTRLAGGLVYHPELTAAPAGATVTGSPAYPAAYVTGTAALDGKSFLDTAAVGDFERGQTFSYGCWVNPENGNGVPVSRMDVGSDYRGWDLFLAGGKPAVHIIHKWPENALKVISTEMIPNGRWTHLFVTYDGSGKPAGVHIYINGRSVNHTTEADALTDTIRTEKPFRIGGRYGADGFTGKVDDVRVYSRTMSADDVALLAETGPLHPLLATAPETRTAEQQQTLLRYGLRASDPGYRRLTTERAQAAAARDTYEASLPTTMVMAEMPKPRDCWVLLRGQYDHHGEKVTAALPAAFGKLPAGAPDNRLGLARWIVSPDNPLTARVAVNRYWEKFFGTGIVATTEDFGVRAEFPSHPELLDWLATEFVRLGWNMKAIQKEMVMSATYRQASRITPELLRRDPENRLLARGPRFRLPAEVIRDQALAAAGLLVNKLGGPSVYPYQPNGVWDELSVYGNLRHYKHDTGDGLYRRSLYTIWKRTAPPPLMSLFDVPGRDICRVRRARTDTPLQALALLNDETFVEASRVLAERMLTEGGADPATRLTYAFRCAAGRRPTPAELAILKRGVAKRLAHYRAAPDTAAKLVAIGDSPVNPKLDKPELAAYTTAASIILNLDETITKE